MPFGNVHGIRHTRNATSQTVLSPQLAQRMNENHRQGEIRVKLGPSSAIGTPRLHSEEHQKIQQVEHVNIRAVQGHLKDTVQSNFFTQKVLGKGHAKELYHIG